MSKIPIKIVAKGGIGRKVFKGSELVLGGNQPLPMTQADYDFLSGLPVTANLAAHFKFNTGITESGGAVSQWDDQSGNGRHLKQATATNQPAKQGDGSILFDGVDNVMRCDAFTLNQPETVYILFKQVTWTNSDTFYDGNANNSMRFRQGGVSPQIGINTSGTVQSVSPALDTYCVVSAVFNGANSVLQLNSDAPVTGDVGATNAGGFCLGFTPSANFAHMQVKEVVIYSAAHDAATRALVIAYLNGL